MAKIYIVRHGQAATDWGEDDDPPLSNLGNTQAVKVASELKELLGQHNDFQIISSPIKRARETSTPFCNLVSQQVVISDKVAEIPIPITDMSKRMPWLIKIMKSSWNALSPELNDWRQECISYLKSLEQDTVIFSHFVAINVAIGYCQKKEPVIVYHPDNTSIHIFENNQDLQIISLGKEADTKIN